VNVENRQCEGFEEFALSMIQCLLCSDTEFCVSPTFVKTLIRLYLKMSNFVVKMFDIVNGERTMFIRSNFTLVLCGKKWTLERICILPKCISLAVS